MARNPKYPSHATPHFWREMQLKTCKRDKSTSRDFVARGRPLHGELAASRPKKARSARQEVDL